MELVPVREVSLPRTFQQWKDAASKEKIEILFSKKDGEDIEPQIQLEILKNNGKPPVGVRLRSLGGWKSASEVTLAHYLTTRSLWCFEGVKPTRTKFESLTKLTKEADEISKQHMKTDQGWKEYRNDIKASGREPPPPGSATPLGNWTIVRFQQLAILRAETSDRPEAAGNVSSRTRSKSMPTAADAPASGDEGDLLFTDPEASQPHDGTTNLSDSDPMSTDQNLSDASLPGVLQGTSDRSAVDPDMMREMVRGSWAEDVVNLGAVTFLQTASMGCSAAQLDWDAYKQPFKVQLGYASIRAVTDGCLRPRDGSEVCAILEVKPFGPEKDADRVFMQMGMELMAWIATAKDVERRYDVNFKLSSPDTGGRLTSYFRYALVSQHYDDIFLTVARFSPGYLAYLLDEKEVSTNDAEVPTNDDDFLKLHCFGPFNIFIHKQVRAIGRMLQVLTIQESMDRIQRQNL